MPLVTRRSGVEVGPAPAGPDFASINERLEREFSCDHPTMALRKLVKSNGVVSYRRQCVRCGESTTDIRVATLPEPEKARAEPFDGDARSRWYSTRAARHRALVEDARSERDEQWHAWYSSYLLSPAWRTKRAAVLRRDNHTCQGCLSRTATEVHHLTYEHVGNELLFELAAICDVCHAIVHDRPR